MTHSDECLIAALNKLAEISELTRGKGDLRSIEIFEKTGTTCEWVLSATEWSEGDAKKLVDAGLSSQAIKMIGWRHPSQKQIAISA
jgi:hypothetical protein